MDLKEKLKLLGFTSAQMKNKDDAALQGMHDETVLTLRGEGKTLPWEELNQPGAGDSVTATPGTVIKDGALEQLTGTGPQIDLVTENAELNAKLAEQLQINSTQLARIVELEATIETLNGGEVIQPPPADLGELLGEGAESRLVAHDFTLLAPEPMVVGERVYRKGEKVQAVAGERVHASAETVTWLQRQSLLKG